MSGTSRRVVEAHEAGWRFDKWARHHFPEIGFGRLQKLLRTGQFRLDGKRLRSGDRVQAGQEVRVPPISEDTLAASNALVARQAPPLKPQDREFVRSLVLYEDEHLIVVDKPPGLAVQGGSGTRRHLDGMLDALAAAGERPRLVHRLDRGTSGVLVLARNAEIAKWLGFALQQHRVRKLYWAILVRGPERWSGEIDLALQKVGRAGSEKMATSSHHGASYDGASIDGAPHEAAKSARTRFMVLSRAGKIAAWTALMPMTGRTHQLRAHTAAIAAPILGDGKYGGRAAYPSGAPAGLMLHARELELPMPDGRQRRFCAEPPPAFRDALAWLGLHPPQRAGATLNDWPHA